MFKKFDFDNPGRLGLGPVNRAFAKLKNESGKHKDWYSVEFIRVYSKLLKGSGSQLNSKSLIGIYTKDHKDLELKQRLSLIAELLHDHLDGDYRAKLDALSSLLGDPLASEEGMFTSGFYLYPISQFIEMYGVEDVDRSLSFIEKLTTRFTGEWAIRPLANHSPSKVLTQMKKWSKNEDLHIRRLASEGLRYRLPWGQKITWVQSHPQKTIPIYNKLRNDPSLYVRRSVANSMGDLIKLDHDLALSTLYSWFEKKHTKENLWVIKHAIRNPVKKKVKVFMDFKSEIELAIKMLK